MVLTIAGDAAAALPVLDVLTGVHVQACGHYMHFDCCRRYTDSLRQVRRQYPINHLDSIAKRAVRVTVSGGRRGALPAHTDAPFLAAASAHGLRGGVRVTQSALLRNLFEGRHLLCLDAGEFLCPICRRVANTLLPLCPPSLPPPPSLQQVHKSSPFQERAR
jgi:hypothetical protein